LQPALDVAPGLAEGLLRSELDRMARTTAAPIAPIGLVGFLWTSTSGMHALMDVFELAVGVPRRAWWKQRLIALAWVLLGLGVVVGAAWGFLRAELAVHGPDEPATTVASPMGSLEHAAQQAAAPSARSEEPREHASTPRSHAQGKSTPQRSQHVGGRGILSSTWQQALAVLVMLLTCTTFLAGFYRFAVEHPQGMKRHYWPGAFTAVTAWLAVSWGFSAYVKSLANYAVYYGGLAAVAVLLVWLYLTALTLVIGAEVNAQLEGVRG
jgi:membrane protein